jgi:hypothetical protein
MSAVTTLRPGYLVALKTSIKGNVSYSKQDLDFLRLDDGASKTKWETERTVKNEREQEEASEIRSKARSLIGSVCSATDFGYLCPLSRKGDLDAAVAEARKLCTEFNGRSTVTRLRFRFFTGYVADNDKEAINAINSEVRDLLDEMKAGLQALDVDKVRNAANKLTQVGQMLTDDAEAAIQLAVKDARSLARKIVKAGEAAAIEIDKATIRRLTETRTAFLDVDMEDREIVTPGATARAIDLAPEAETISGPAPVAHAVEVD